MFRIVTVLSILAFSHASVWDNLNTTIVVLEYSPVQKNLTKDSVFANTLQYFTEAVSAYVENNNKLDLIVFPEDTLRDDRNTSCEVNLNTNCQTSQCEQHLKAFSDLARTLNTYLVVNLVEKEKCVNNNKTDNCKKFGYSYYNTDVVFGRNGTVINRYRKFNLFGEYDLDKPEKVDRVVINTDFGVKFGIFTCFDILFKSPAQDLVVEDKVDGIIFPTMWFSELPFLTAIQTQEMWAYKHNITFLAAGANNPRVGSGGSGIIRGRNGRVSGGILGLGGTKAFSYVSVNGTGTTLPSENIKELALQMDNFKLKREKTVDSFNSTILNTGLAKVEHQLCYKTASINISICCNFSVEMSRATLTPNFKNYTYRMVAYSGVRSFDGVYNGGIDVCGIIACTDHRNLSSCGQRFSNYSEVQWPVTFRNITIVARFEKSVNKTQFPNSLLSSILPIKANETVWIEKDVNANTVERIFSTTNQNQLLTFAIYGRNFALDSLPSKGNNSGNPVKIAPFLLVASVLFSLFRS